MAYLWICLQLQFTVFVLLSDNMKNLLKYLLLGIIAMASYNGARKEISVNETDTLANFPNGYTLSYNSFLPLKEAGLCLPAQVTSANSFRLQNSSRRHEASHRQNFPFIHSCKTYNPAIRLIVQEQSSLSYSSLIMSSYRLHYLGQYII